MEISFSGLASGLDTQSLIAALVAVEQRPISLLQGQQGDLREQRRLFNQFDDLLTSLQDKAEEFGDADSFLSLSTSLSSNNFFTATAESGAQVAAHDVKVLQLATTGREVTTGVADSDTTTFGTGTINIDVGSESKSISIDGTNNTLGGVVDAINAADAGVRASIIDDGGANPFRIVIQTEETGEENDLTVDFGTVSLAIDGALTQAADNAEVEIDGLTIERSSNTVEGAIQGVTLNLIQDSDDDDDGNFDSIRLDVAVDRDAISDRLQEFIDSYNAVVDFVSDQSSFNEASESSGPLAGDTTLRSAIRQIQTQITSPLTDSSSSFRILADIGIQFAEEGGRLEIDSTTLDEALEGDLDEVAAIFTDETDGIAVNLEGILDTFTDSIDGLIKTRVDGFDDRISNLDDSIERAERRLESYEQTLVNRYANLESLIGGLNAQSAFLSNAL